MATLNTDKFLFALTFFTRLPLGRDRSFGSNLAEAAMAFPLAGLAIGLMTGMAWWIAASLLPPLTAAGIAIGFAMLLTGALHEDGLSDCADGLGGGSTRERILEIMRDSRIGSYGAAALTISIGLRWAALSGLGAWSGLLALAIAHAVSRGAIVLALAWSAYARTKGLGSIVSSGVSARELNIVVALSAAIALLFGGISGLIAAAAGCAIAWLVLKRLEARIGGYTGDGLGAMQQGAEITILVMLAGFWS